MDFMGPKLKVRLLWSWIGNKLKSYVYIQSQGLTKWGKYFLIYCDKYWYGKNIRIIFVYIAQALSDVLCRQNYNIPSPTRLNIKLIKSH